MSDNTIIGQIPTTALWTLFSEHLILASMDLEGRILEVNDQYCCFTGYSREELIGSRSRLFNSGHHSDLFFKELWETIRAGKTWQGDIKNLKKSGVHYWVRTSIIPLLNPRGEVDRFIYHKIDITQVKSREEKWNFEEEVLREVASITKTGGWTYYPGSEEVIWSEQTYHLHDVPLGEKITLERAINFYLPEARAILQESMEKSIRDHVGWSLELPVKTEKGRVFWAYAVGKIEVRNSEVYRLYGTFQDISERKEAMDLLLNNRERLNLYLKHTPAAIAVFDREMKYLAWSDRWVRDYSLQQMNLEGMSHYDVFPDMPDRWRDDHRRVLAGEVYVNEDDCFVRFDGKVDYLRYELHPLRDFDGSIAGIFMFTEVITERKLAEIERKNLDQQLQKTQRLESLGVLAGGIAHDFNNLLTGILGNAEFIRELAPSQREILEPLEIIEDAAHRASELCGQMLAYAGRGQIEKAPIQLNDLIIETSKLVKHSIAKTIYLNFDLQQDLPIILADVSQIRQIVMNLMINAADAMGDQEGEILIQSQSQYFNETDFKKELLSQNPRPGDYVKLKVQDNGCGMSPETLARIFEPFFTTKFTGRGLGLSAVVGIIHGHGGVLSVTSQMGKGSVFEIYLPYSSSDGSTVVTKSQATLWRGKGLVLLVEDEVFIREITSRRLRSLGFEVIESGNGYEALDLFLKNQSQIVFVLTDLTMPKMSGGQLLEKIKAIEPSIPCVMMSAYSQDEIQRYLDKYLEVFYLQKPADLEIFYNVLKRAYERSSRS